MTIPASVAGELDAHLVLLLGREDVDDAVDRLRRALGVQRREDEVAGLGRGQRGRDRLEVAHLADEDHVGVLAQRGAERRSANDVASEPISRWLTMHRRCQCRNSIGSSIVRMCSERVVVDAVDQRRERRRLAGAGRAGDEHEAARLVAQLVEPLGHPQLLERADPGGDQAERGAHGRALEVGVDAEAREARDRRTRSRAGARSRAASAGRSRGSRRSRSRVSSGDSGVSSGRRSSWPWTRMTGGEPTARWRSEASASTILASRSSIERGVVSVMSDPYSAGGRGDLRRVRAPHPPSASSPSFRSLERGTGGRGRRLKRCRKRARGAAMRAPLVGRTCCVGERVRAYAQAPATTVAVVRAAPRRAERGREDRAGYGLSEAVRVR